MFSIARVWRRVRSLVGFGLLLVGTKVSGNMDGFIDGFLRGRRHAKRCSKEDHADCINFRTGYFYDDEEGS